MDIGNQSLQSIVNLVKEVKTNYGALLEEWNGLKSKISPKDEDNTKNEKKTCGQSKNVLVKKNDLAQLATEIAQLKQNLPKVLNKNVITACGRIQSLEDENAKLKEHCRQLTLQLEETNFKYDKAIAEAQAEKQECLRLRCEIQSQTSQLSQQSDYCNSLGSACCTLLWRVSRQEDNIHNILTGTKVDEFLSLVSTTLQSYLSAYKDEWPQDDLEENQFILALCGVVTNIAASAYGRDFLVSNAYGREVLDTNIVLLSQVPAGKSPRLKNLTMMSLYNVSINQKGLKYLHTNGSLLSLAAWLVQVETDSELRVNTLRLIQSLVLDETNPSTQHELNEMLPGEVLEEMSNDRHKEVREMVVELITDLHQLQQHRQVNT